MLRIVFTIFFHLLSAVCSAAGERCPFDTMTSSIWDECDCVGDAQTQQMKCTRLHTTTLPILPALKITKVGLRESRPIVSTLAITNSAVNYINQDTFRKNGNSISVLLMNANQIETVNVNAFRGLENSLTKLSLNHNYLTSIPGAALLYLQNLFYLELQHNRIEHIKSETFAQTRLTNLRFLHLDHNLLTRLPESVLANLKLEVLTLDSNRLTYIEPDALPSTIWWLSLKNNEFDKMPFDALKSLVALERLDLGGNRLRRLFPAENIVFKREMTLDLSNNRLRQLDKYAFKNFRKFKKLDLSFNQLAYIPDKFLETVGYMEHLDLSHNNLAGIPLSAFKPVARTLQTLNLEENELHTLPIALRPLTELELLNLKYNKLTKLDNQTMARFKLSLKYLFLGYNSLTEVPTQAIQGMLKLEKLDLSQNRIKLLPNMAFGSFSGAGSNLAELSLAGNHLTTILEPGAFLYMSSLVYLDLSHNRLSGLGPRVFGRLVGLETLNLQSNRLTYFPSTSVEGTHRIRVLRLDDNQIMGLPPHALHNMPHLVHLTLSRNTILSIDNQVFASKMVPRLKSVDLSHNHVKHLSAKAFADLRDLQVLSLQANQIPKLDTLTFHNLSSLIQLDLSINRINVTEHMAFSDLPQLLTLKMRQNRISRLPRGTFVNVPSLETLILAQNQFADFSADFLDNPKSLRVLDLSYNRIRAFSLDSVSLSIEQLDLSNNEIQRIDHNVLSGFSALKYLNLSRNGMVHIDSAAFMGCPKLVHVNLAGNYLAKIEKGTFSNQKSLIKVDLSGNTISRIDPGSFGKDNLIELDLNHNQLTSIPYASLSSVRNSLSRIDLNGNRINSIQSLHFDGLNNLTVLILRNNKIDTIEEAAFEGLHRLEHLDLRHNPITTWHPQAFRDLSHAIVSLQLADTGLFSMPRIGTRSMTHLNISHNQIYALTIEDLKPLKKLQTLDLCGNQLKKLQDGLLEEMFDLKHLNLSDNRFTIIHDHQFRALHKLETLTMHTLPFLDVLPSTDAFRFWVFPGAKILCNDDPWCTAGLQMQDEAGRTKAFGCCSTIWLRNLRRLELYDISGLRHRPIREVLTNLPPLRAAHIELTDSTLDTQLHGADFRFLNELRITGRSLKRIETAAFQSVRGYQFRLAITGTEIQTFPETIFHTLNQVTLLQLDLSNNLLRSVEPFIHLDGITFVNHHGTMLYDIDLSENLLVCDCRIAWVSPWLHHWQRILPHDQFLSRLVAWNRTRCNEPDRYQHQAVTKIDFARDACYIGESGDSASSGTRLGAGGLKITTRLRHEPPQVRVMSLAVINFALVCSSVMDFVSGGTW